MPIIIFFLSLLFIFSVIDKSVAQTVILSPIEMEIKQIHVNKGEIVKKGDKLVTFDCMGNYKKLRALKLKTRSLEQTYLKDLQLEELGMVSKRAVEKSRHAFEKQDKKRKKYQKIQKECVVKATEAGRVGDIFVTLPNKPLNGEALLSLDEVDENASRSAVIEAYDETLKEKESLEKIDESLGLEQIDVYDQPLETK